MVSVQVEASLDMWSLGVIALELFSGRPALKVFQGHDQVRASSLGALL